MRRTIPKMVSDFEGAMFASRSGTEGICEVAGECGRPGGANTYNGPCRLLRNLVPRERNHLDTSSPPT